MLLLFLAIFLHVHPTLEMLDCDPVFVKDLGLYLSTKVPSDVPNRKEYLDSLSNEILGVYRSYFRQKKYLRLLDVRSVSTLKEMVIHDLKGKEFNGMNAYWLLVRSIRYKLMHAMKKSLEDLTDLACSEDCSVIEGPVLDCWTCLRVRAQCFSGSVCGGEDPHDAEKREIVVYLFLVVLFTVLASILMLCYIYIYHSKAMRMITQMESENENLNVCSKMATTDSVENNKSA